MNKTIDISELIIPDEKLGIVFTEQLKTLNLHSLSIPNLCYNQIKEIEVKNLSECDLISIQEITFEQTNLERVFLKHLINCNFPTLSKLFLDNY